MPIRHTQSPFFIVGFGRSGTTLLAAMIDRHPDLCVTPETGFFTEAMTRFESVRRPKHQQLLEAWIGDKRMADLGIDPDALTERFHDEMPTPANLLAVTLELYRDTRQCRRAGEKTPAHLWYVPGIMQWYPDAKVICIVRDGRDCINSMLKTPWGRGNPIRVAMQWASAASLNETYALRYGPDRYYAIRYEDLLTDPAGVMRTVMAFLGEQFHPCQLDPSIKPGVVPHWELGWKGKVDKQVDTSRCHAWRRENDPRFTWLINALIGPALRRMGYPDTQLVGCPAVLRAGLLAIGAAYRQVRKPHHLRSMMILHQRIAQVVTPTRASHPTVQDRTAGGQPVHAATATSAPLRGISRPRPAA